MEYTVCIVLLIITIILYWIVFKINIRKIKSLEKNDELTEITDKFPENIEIANEMLDMLSVGVRCTCPKIEQATNTKTSLYIAITNKIIIADMKNNYARIQTIAHECIHSGQDRRLLLFNFIFSNISLLYFVIITLLTLFKVIDISMLQVFILTLLALIKFSVRSFLEIDAMTRSRYLAEKYINKTVGAHDCALSENDITKLLAGYDKINRLGIPFVINNLLTNAIVQILVYMAVGLIMMQ